MKENLPGNLSFACAVTCLALAVLSARLAQSPATRHFRYSAAAAFAATLFCLGQSVVAAEAGDTLTIWAARITLAAACLHQAAWLRFVPSWMRRDPTRTESWLLAACLVAAALVLIPGVGTKDVLEPRTVIAGVAAGNVRLPEAGPAGLLSMALSIVVQVHIARTAMRSVRETRRASVLVASFLLLIVLGIVDGVTVAFKLPLPLVAGAGFVIVAVGVGTVMVEGAIETSKTLDRRSSELDRTRGALVERERLASLGELAAVVAHEVRNPLAVVFNAVAGLRRSPPRSPDEVVLLDIIDQEANRLKRLVVTLLDVARPFEPQVAPHDIAALVRSAAALATQPEGRGSADVAIDLDGLDGATFVFDEVLIVQALSNLLANALDAPGRTAPVRLRVTTGASGRVRFEVSDDGAGVADADRDRIFSPFFTTRATGTGLGLTLVKRIAEAHRGVAFLETAGDRGACFVLELPARSLP